MKKITIEIRVDENSQRIATAWKTDGYSRESLTDLFEMMGIIDNFKNILSDKVKTLLEKKL
jgi:hypothetical protein